MRTQDWTRPAISAAWVIFAAIPVAQAEDVTFRVEVPYCTPPGSTVYLRSNRESEDAFRHDALRRIDASHFEGTVAITTARADFRYKYSHSICNEAACPGIEKTLEYDGSGHDYPDRTLPEGVGSVTDHVIVWRSALYHLDADAQLGEPRTDEEQVAFCAPYLSVSDEQGSIAIGYDSFAASEVALEWGRTDQLGERAVRGGAHRNHFDLTGLTPGERYFYRIVDDGVPGPIESFRAPPAPGAPFRFGFLGDTQFYGDEQRIEHEKVQALLDEFEPDLIVAAGDLVASERGESGPGGWNFPEMGRFSVFFASAAPMMARVPFMTAMGNHEEDAPYYWSVFKFPTPDAPALDHYWFRYGNVHFTVLYTGTTDAYDFHGILDSQTPWMDGVLDAANRDPNIRFKVVVLHRGPHSQGEKHPTDGQSFFEDESGGRPSWRSLWQRHGVDLVLAGHNHNFTFATEAGIHYLTACSGAPLHELRTPWLGTTRYAERTCTANLLTVTDETITFEARRTDGSVIDDAAFVLCHEDADCADLPAEPCERDFAWRCVERECTPECASPPPDAGPSDAGTDVGPLDAGTRDADAGPGPPPGGGCECRTAGGAKLVDAFPLVWVVLLLLACRRRG